MGARGSTGRFIQSEIDDRGPAPLNVPFDAEEPMYGHKVLVRWGEARGLVGTVTGTPQNGVYVSFSKPNETYSGLFVADSLRKVLDKAPKFTSLSEAEDWLERATVSTYVAGDHVRISVERSRDKEITYGKVLKYLGITETNPPQYLIQADLDPDNIRIVTEYFIHGLVSEG